MGGPWKRKPQIGSAQAHGADDNRRLPEPGRCPQRALAFVPAVWSFLAPAPEPGLQPGPVPTFSVVIPAYQAADTVGEAVASVFAQTVAPEELIVVNDGSTDDIEGALAPYRERITLISKENGGRASALNLGVGEANGEYVSFLDADDAYQPERIEALGALASMRPDLDLLVTDASLEVEGRIVGRFCAETPFAVEDQRLAILDRCFIVCPCVRRARLLDVGGFYEAFRFSEDWDCWIRLIMRGFCRRPRGRSAVQLPHPQRERHQQPSGSPTCPRRRPGKSRAHAGPHGRRARGARAFDHVESTKSHAR